MNSNPSYKTAFSLLTSLFFMWGFITVMNDILINTFQSIFDLTPTRQSYVQVVFFGAFFVISLIYFLISSNSGKDPINKIGYKNGMAISLIICGVGSLAFYPAALMNSYSAFLAALFIVASGVTLLQICANPYATILGNSASASSRLNLAQGFNSLGTTLAPLVGTILIYKVFSGGEQSASSIGNAYLINGLIFIVLAIMVRFSKMPSFTNTEKIENGLEIFKQRHLVLGIFAIFFYVGSEVSIGSWIVKFIKDNSIMGLEEAEANYFLSYFWGGLMIGRLMASVSLNEKYTPIQKLVIMPIISLTLVTIIYLVTSLKVDDQGIYFDFLSLREIAIYLIFLAVNYLAFIISKGQAARSLVIFSTINVLLIAMTITSTGELAFWSIIGTGLFFSIGWSNVFSLAIKDLGKYTSQGSSLLVMAIVGGAALPFIQSQIIEIFNVQTSFIVPLLGVIYLIYYGISGHKIKQN